MATPPEKMLGRAACNIETLRDEPDMLDRISKATAPLRILYSTNSWRAVRDWQSIPAFLDSHGNASVGIVSGVAVASMGPEQALARTWVRGPNGHMRLASSVAASRRHQPSRLVLPLREYLQAVHNGTLPRDAYVFHDLAGPDLRPLADRLRDVADMFRSCSITRTHGLRALKSLPPRAGSGRLRLALGAAGSGNTWHMHGDALNLVLGGQKRWWLYNRSTYQARRAVQNAPHWLPTPDWLAQATAHNEPMPTWHCTQRAGELIFVPGGIPHAVLNVDGDALAVAVQHDAEGAGLLHLAARDGDVETAKALLVQAAMDVDARDTAGRTALYEAADRGHLDVVEALLGAGADPTLAERNGMTPAFRAAARGDQKAAKLLAGAGRRRGGGT